jgi:hypothetical protein
MSSRPTCIDITSVTGTRYPSRCALDVQEGVIESVFGADPRDAVEL